MNLAKRLVDARKKLGLSQVDIAKKLDISPGTVGGWETGTHSIRLDRLKAVADVYELKVEDLIKDMLRAHRPEPPS